MHISIAKSSLEIMASELYNDIQKSIIMLVNWANALVKVIFPQISILGGVILDGITDFVVWILESIFLVSNKKPLI